MHKEVLKTGKKKWAYYRHVNHVSGNFLFPYTEGSKCCILQENKKDVSQKSLLILEG